MANPIIVVCLADVWTKVATNVTSGFIHIKDTSPNVYLQTYRETGDPVPVGDTEAIPFGASTEIISASLGIDVYIKPTGEDGKVRVDL